MTQVYAFTVTRANTPSRRTLLENTLRVGKSTAGVDLTWTVRDGSIGQHIVWNEEYAKALESGAQYFLRIDDDCKFLTKRWLKKLLSVSYVFDDKAVISPLVKGLKNPPARSDKCRVGGYDVEFLIEAIGGICRLHPMPLIEGFTADVRKPMGSGDATGIGLWCQEHKIPMVYARNVRIKHDTLTQERDDPSHFSTHDILQHIPYLPPWRPT